MKINLKLVNRFGVVNEEKTQILHQKKKSSHLFLFLLLHPVLAEAITATKDKIKCILNITNDHQCAY